MVSARGLNALATVSAILSILLHASGLTSIVSPIPWTKLEKGWSIAMPIMLLIAAIICLIVGSTNYNNAPHCVLSKDFASIVSGTV